MILSSLPASVLPSLALLSVDAARVTIEARRLVALSTISRMVEAGRSPMHVARYVYSLGLGLGSEVVRSMEPHAQDGTFAAAVLDILTDAPWYA